MRVQVKMGEATRAHCFWRRGKWERAFTSHNLAETLLKELVWVGSRRSGVPSPRIRAPSQKDLLYEALGNMRRVMARGSTGWGK